MLCLHSETGNVQNECESYRRYSLQVMIIIDGKWFRLELMFKTIVKISGYFTKMRVFKTLKTSLPFRFKRFTVVVFLIYRIVRKCIKTWCEDLTEFYLFLLRNSHMTTQSVTANWCSTSSWKRKWIQLCSILKLSCPFLTKKYACEKYMSFLIFSQYTYDRGIPVAGLLVLLIPEIVRHPSVSLSACLSTSYVSVSICFSGHFVWERHWSSWLVCSPRVLVA